MRTVTLTHNVYKFEELSAKAKDKARLFIADEYNWTAEAEKTIEKLADRFGVKIWNLEWNCDDFTYSKIELEYAVEREMTPDELLDAVNALGDYDRKTLKGLGDCVLTGTFTDELAIDGLRQAYANGERIEKDLVHAAFASLREGMQLDWEDQQSDEQCAETANCNNWEFDQHGNLWRD